MVSEPKISSGALGAMVKVQALTRTGPDTVSEPYEYVVGILVAYSYNRNTSVFKIVIQGYSEPFVYNLNQVSVEIFTH